MPATVNRILVDIGGDLDDDHDEGGSLSGSVFVTGLAYFTIALFLIAVVANLFFKQQVNDLKQNRKDRNVLWKILLFIVEQTGSLLSKFGVMEEEGTPAARPPPLDAGATADATAADATAADNPV